MQIHELNTLTGEISGSDYLAVDNGLDTMKAPVTQIIEPAIEAERKVNTLDNKKVNKPLDTNNQPYNGRAGQLLRSRGNDTTEWADVGLPTDEQTAQAVSDWLDEHPEATTTVQDESITLAKLASDVEKPVNAVNRVNVKDFMIGTTDIGVAINNIINNTDYQEIFIPKGNYSTAVEITVNRAIKIVGESSWYIEGDGIPPTAITPYIESSASKCINVTCPNVTIEALSVRAVDYGIYAEYYINGSISSIYNVHIINCTAQHCANADFYMGMTVQCSIRNCCALGGNVGYSLAGGQNTSTIIENCWARNLTTGYYLQSMTYCTILNCCCDIAEHGFDISACKSTSFIGCASELAGTAFWLDSCDGITFIEPFGAYNGKYNDVITSASGSLISMWTGTKNVNIFGGKNVEKYNPYDITTHSDSLAPNSFGIDALSINFETTEQIIKNHSSVLPNCVKQTLIYQQNVTIAQANKSVLISDLNFPASTFKLLVSVTGQSAYDDYIFSHTENLTAKQMRFNASVAQTYVVWVYALYI